MRAALSRRAGVCAATSARHAVTAHRGCAPPHVLAASDRAASCVHGSFGRRQQRAAGYGCIVRADCLADSLRPLLMCRSRSEGEIPEALVEDRAELCGALARPRCASSSAWGCCTLCEGDDPPRGTLSDTCTASSAPRSTAVWQPRHLRTHLKGMTSMLGELNRGTLEYGKAGRRINK